MDLRELFKIALVSAALLGNLLAGSPSWAAEYKYIASAAATYADTNWNLSYGKNGNPFTDYERVPNGGNCTNFASQCIMAGLVNSYKPVVVFQNRTLFVADKGSSLSWYFISDKDRGPAFTGANKLYEYAKNNRPTNKGLHFVQIPFDFKQISPGDIVFADWDRNGIIDHSMVVRVLYGNINGFNRIRLTYQTTNTWDKGFGDLIAQKPSALFYVFRPVNYTTTGK